MEQPIRIGMIGLDTSHAPAFAELFNDATHSYHVHGGQVVAAYPGGSADFPLSINRVAGFTAELREKYGAAILDSPEAVAEQADAILLITADGRLHEEQFRAVAPYGKPVFIDKPLTVDPQAAERISELAERHRIPVMSASALRYAEALTVSLDSVEDGAEIHGADCFGPMQIEPTQSGFYWYGIHTADMLYRIMGPGCSSVSAVSSGDSDSIVGIWEDGRIGTIRGSRRPGQSYAAAIHTTAGTKLSHMASHAKPYYASLLERVIRMFKTGQCDVRLEETIEIIKFLDAANRSVATGGQVKLNSR
ncbi:Gfo/Idh/MocA family protein [Paenibacillus puerhi]|uniref:Gfo/Idh/MocA family protein n=1 Tax=Paenibacillus puerhi TaxID=2692622 RepID=UPI0013584717|nr:Gfo/Idh/MocA family oxidoreductase [Paenibacillus puerhi]